MTLKECVEKIITENFRPGEYFDTHTVINMILQNNAYHLAYLQEFKQDSNNYTVGLYHGYIAQRMIEPLSSIVTKAEIDKIKTQTIFCEQPEINQLWKRI